MPSRKAVRSDDGRLSAQRMRGKPVPYRSRYQLLIDGDLSVEDLTDDEIMNGRCLNRDGNFKGRPPATFPRALHDAMRKEFQKRIQEKLNNTADVAVQTLLDIAMNHRASADARVKASVVLLERTMGKVPDKIEAFVESKAYEQDIEGLFVDIPDEVADLAAKRQEKSA